jgi:hypothetical protein
MKTQQSSKPNVVPSTAMTVAVKKRLQAVAEKLADRELFPEKIREAKKALKGLTVLPT